MKEIELIYTATWFTSVEVPDDFEITPDSIQELAEANEKDFNFQDGGASWGLDIEDTYRNLVGMPCSE